MSVSIFPLGNLTPGKVAQVVGLWLDTTNGEDSWIVSRDAMNANGEAETTRTIDVFFVDANGDAYELAKNVALELARAEGLPLIQTDTSGAQECLYTPETES